MARRSDHTKDELKQMILDSAVQIIKTDSYKALTARKLAAAIGYVPGTIYNIYGSMDGVALAVSAETLDHLGDHLKQALEKSNDQTLTERLKSLSDAYGTFIENNQNLWRMLFEHSLDNGEIPDWFQNKIDGLFIFIEAVLAAETDNSHTPDTDQIALQARALWSAVHGVYFLEQTGKLSLINKSFSTEDLTHYLIEKTIEY